MGTTPPRLSPIIAIMMLIAACMAWSGNHAVARAIAGKVPPASVNALRWLIVAVLVGIFARHHIARDWPTLRRSWVLMTLLGVTGGGIFGTLQYVGMQYTTVVNMGMFNSVAPPMIVLASWLTFRDRLRPIQILGIAVSLLGVLVMVSRLDIEVLKSFAFNRGDVIIIANMVLWALYSSYLRLRPQVSLWSFLFALSVPAALINLPWAIYEHASGQVYDFGPMALSATAYAAIGTSIIGYFGWSRGVEALGPGRASVYLHVIPIFGTILGITLFGERFQLFHAVGIALILTGVVLTARASPSAMPKPL